MDATIPARRENALLDALACAVLVTGTVLYLHQWPRDLNAYDEGVYLYEAERILSGDVMYRDFFDVAAPGSYYAMSLLFRVFGPNIETARAGMTGPHALIVALLYVACRRLGIRRPVAALAAAAEPALFFPTFPIASPHWSGTLLGLLALCIAVRAPIRSPARAAVLGVVTGLLAVTQHQKAPIMGLGIAFLLALDTRRAWRSSEMFVRLAVLLLAFAGGAAAVVVPCAVALLAAAGPRRIYDVLFLYPLAQYPGYHKHVGWGYFPWLTHPGVELGVRELAVVYSIKYLPGAAIVVAARSLLRVAAGASLDAVRPALVAVLFAALAALGIAYNPDFVHLGIIGALWIAPVALLLEAALTALESVRGPPRFAGAVAMAGLALLMAWQLSFNIEWRRSLYTHSHDTAFGRLDFHDADETVVIDAIRERAKSARSRELFAFPAYASLYLMTGTVNPTPYQILVEGYSVPAQFDEVIDILERRKVPFVAYSPYVVRARKHPVARYVLTGYDRIDLPARGRLPIISLYQRRD